MATRAEPQHFMATSGAKDSVWINKDPCANRHQFPQLGKNDLQADMCIVASGIAGVSTASELYAKEEGAHDKKIEEPKQEVAKSKELGLPVSSEKGHAVKGWDGEIDQRDAAIFHQQATFHPTKYINGILDWLSKQSRFSCFTRTRVVSVEEKGVEVLGFGSKDVKVSTLDGHTVTCENAVEATCIPLQKLSVVAQLEFMRTYCIAMRVPRGYIEDCLIYDQAEPYHYARLTACNEEDDYLIVGGGDHKVGQEQEDGRFAELESWTRERFTKAKSVDYTWSGQVLNPVDGVAMIGLNQGQSHVYTATGDAGNGLIHYVLGGKLIADLLTKTPNPWSSLYSLSINTQYKRCLQSDILDIEDLAPGTGVVLNNGLSKPIAVYKDEQGKVSKFSALCPHRQGVVCWNKTEQSWDCPIHGSRFARDGPQIMGPAKAGVASMDDEGEARQTQAVQG